MLPAEQSPLPTPSRASRRLRPPIWALRSSTFRAGCAREPAKLSTAPVKPPSKLPPLSSITRCRPGAHPGHAPGRRKAARTSELLGNGIDLGYVPDAQLALVGGKPSPNGNGRIVVACAGTSDLPVAEEAALTAEFYGNAVDRLYDVGVAGLHRLLAHAEELAQAQVVIAIAGMEGALASVIGGLVSCPVIAVPTSVGYGANFGGMAALLAMLNSCASGVRSSISTTAWRRLSRQVLSII